MHTHRSNFRTFLFTIAILLILGGGAVSAFVRYYNSDQRNQTLIFSKNTMLYEMWQDYKKKYIESSTYRAVDRDQNNITTSEGQSYSMMRAVWMGDRDTFDKSWAWTKKNLQREDKLFSWKYGPLADGSYGIQKDIGGGNTASDADSDIALSLLMAYTRWNETSYLAEAKPIIASMWEKDVLIINGKPILAANDLEKQSTSQTAIVNPSYFSPYAYKIFASVDKTPGHNWLALVDSSYEVLNRSMTEPLDAGSSVTLPPDWVLIDKKTGALTAPSGNATTNYGFDALRTSWRIGLDWQWFKDERAMDTLAVMNYLEQEWNQKNKLAGIYKHNGDIVGDYETAAMYGGSMGYFTVMNKNTAQKIYEEKLAKTYNPDTQAMANGLNYYDANWAWFGIALYQNALPNLTKQS